MQELDQQEEVSKTRLKQQMHELQLLGELLVELPKDKLAQLDLPESLREAVLNARKITAHGGKRRQLQYIGKLMRTVDPEPNPGQARPMERQPCRGNRIASSS